MNPITVTEDAIIAAGNAALQGKVREMEALPGRMSLRVLQTIAALAPAVYVAYLGGRTRGAAQDGVSHAAVFAVYIVVDHADSKTRGRGDARQIGAYDILNVLLPMLNNFTIKDVGTMQFKGIENLFSVELDKQGVLIYAATFEVPMSFEYLADETALSGFITYSAIHAISPDPDVPTSQDQITLDQ